MSFEKIDNTEAQTSARTIKTLKESNRQLRAQCRELENKNRTLEKQYNTLKSSASYRVGHAIVLAFSKPGMNTIKLPFRLSRYATRVAIRKSKHLYGRSKMWLQDHIIMLAPNKQLTFNYHEFDKKALPESYSALRIACIMDTFTLEAFSPECALIPLLPEESLKTLDKTKPHLLFVESAWHGSDDAWYRKISQPSEALRAIIHWCNEHHIPTVFWNKEDPTHFSTFLATARLFDFVFTTDVDCIQDYKTMLPHHRVYLLPFACQPYRHHPVEQKTRQDKFCFAGAYYERYPERSSNFDAFFDAITCFKGDIDIFSRYTTLPQYSFPARYYDYIKESLAYKDIDTAYKGYRYAINMNSIKRSQSMFSRRVFELLASNTITVSNYSRGLRLFFGDLVISTDDECALEKRVMPWLINERYANKVRLAALRKVLQEHTYHDRLKRIIELVFKTSLPEKTPVVLMLGIAHSDTELYALISHFSRQIYPYKKLLLITTYKTNFSGKNNNPAVEQWDSARAKAITMAQLPDSDYLSGLVPTDYYGPNYLTDLILAVKYSDAVAFGKAAYFEYRKHQVALQHAKQQYHYVNALPYRSAVINRLTVTQEQTVYDWLMIFPTQLFTSSDLLLSVDSFNYCRIDQRQMSLAVDIPRYVNDITSLNTGLKLDTIYQHGDSIVRSNQVKTFSAQRLYQLFNGKHSDKVTIRYLSDQLVITSTLSGDTHDYFYTNKPLRPNELFPAMTFDIYLATRDSPHLLLVFIFLDINDERIGVFKIKANTHGELTIPKQTHAIKMAFRIQGAEKCCINSLIAKAPSTAKGSFINSSDVLLVSNHYPSYEVLYRNAFVHARVKGYLDAGFLCDVFRFNANYKKNSYEFDNVDIYSGYKEELQSILTQNKHHYLFIHFLDTKLWQTIKTYVDNIKLVIWIHGVEAQAWHRRLFNYRNEAEKSNAKKVAKQRMRLWQEVFSLRHPNIQFVFVSNNLAKEVMEDVGVDLLSTQYVVIHNYVNTRLFTYEEKPIEQRKKILSIRPYTSNKYANDLTTQAILKLSKEPFFKELEFRVIGDGELFEQITEPLKDFPNVILERKFLQQAEIAMLHKQYGIFICPTRWDSQGVSRDEAMSSGLVPITNAVSAIPEFVDEFCGILAASEDATGLAVGIRALYFDSEKFKMLSKKAAERVRQQSNFKKTILAELALSDKTISK